MSGRDTPPSIQDGEFGFEPRSISNFPSGDGLDGDEALDAETAKKVALEAYSASTSWLNSSRRAKWNDSLRSFQSRHASGSKYGSNDYRYRSNLYRPKTRSMVRNDEAATASAFFSNDDVVSIQAGDPDDPFQKASAEMMQSLLQYRLTHSENGVPWFLTLVGARQDAEVQGICVAHAYWKFKERYSHTEQRPVLHPITGMPTVDKNGEPETEDHDVMEREDDRPCVDLIPPENIRFEPGADWRDPVNSSPYLIHLIPMYIQDIQERIDSDDPDERWLPVSEGAMRSATDLDDDQTRRSREQDRVPGKDGDAWKPRAFDIGWVRNNIVKWKGRDWQFYTLGSAGELLSEPRPLEDVYLHGMRPFVVGFVVLETHKTYPSSKVEIVADLQRATNDDWNLRFDNVKMSLNPRQFVKTGHGIESQDLRTFAPGKIVLVTAAKDEPIANNIVTWDRPPPPDASAYAEQDRINLDWDELAGSFSNSSVQASQIQQQSATGMHLMSGIAAGMNEYELRVFAESFVEPLIRQLVKLEQAYETDPVILALAGRNAQLMQKYGLNQITDELLNQELTTRVNVGIGATNPTLKMKNLLNVAQALGSVFGPMAAQKADFEEVAKELFGLAGYKDGQRFIIQGGDSVEVMQLKQQLQKLQGKGGQGAQPDPLKLQGIQIQAQNRTQVQQMKAESDARSDQFEMQRAKMQEDAENWRTWIKAAHDAQQSQTQRLHDQGEAHVARAHEMGLGQMDRQFDAGMAWQSQAHSANLAQQTQQHQAGMAQAGHERQFDQRIPAMAKEMAPPAPAAGGTAPVPENGGGNSDAMMGEFTKAMGQMVQAMAGVAEQIKQSNAELAKALVGAAGG